MHTEALSFWSFGSMQWLNAKPKQLPAQQVSEAFTLGFKRQNAGGLQACMATQSELTGKTSQTFNDWFTPKPPLAHSLLSHQGNEPVNNSYVYATCAFLGWQGPDKWPALFPVSSASRSMIGYSFRQTYQYMSASCMTGRAQLGDNDERRAKTVRFA